MANVDRLTALGLPAELAEELVKQISAATSAVAVAEALADKPEIAALTGSSAAADIVTALQA